MTSLLQYSCGLANSPPPPLLKTLDVSSPSATTSGVRLRWSLGCRTPSGVRWCIYARFAFICFDGKNPMSLIPRGSKIFCLMYSPRVRPVARSRAIPAQSMPSCVHVSAMKTSQNQQVRQLTLYSQPSPGWNKSGCTISSTRQLNSSRPAG